MPKTLSWTPKVKWLARAIEDEQEKLSDLGGEAPIWAEEALAPKWEAPPAMPSIEPKIGRAHV